MMQIRNINLHMSTWIKQLKTCSSTFY